MNWQHYPATKHVAALTCSGDYVISHWPEQFCLRYRPNGQHLSLGDFKTLDEAKQAAEAHNACNALPAPANALNSQP